MKQELGIHLIGDLYECDFDSLLNTFTSEYWKDYIIALVKNAGLSVLESAFFVFENNSFSLNVMLSESHLCIHTWPERQYVSLDLFVCNYSRDNTQVAEQLFDDVCKIFHSKNIKVTKIQR